MSFKHNEEFSLQWEILNTVNIISSLNYIYIDVIHLHQFLIILKKISWHQLIFIVMMNFVHYDVFSSFRLIFTTLFSFYHFDEFSSQWWIFSQWSILIMVMNYYYNDRFSSQCWNSIIVITYFIIMIELIIGHQSSNIKVMNIITLNLIFPLL